MNVRIKNASLDDRVAEVIGLGLDDSHDDDAPAQELVVVNGDAISFADGGGMAVDTPAGRPPSDIIGGVTRPELLIGAKSVSRLGSGKLGIRGSGTGSSAGRGSSGDSGALHSGDSAGSWMNVTDQLVIIPSV